MINIFDNFLPEEDYEGIRAFYNSEMDDGTLEGSCMWLYSDGCTLKGDGHFHFTSLVFAANYILVPKAFHLLQPLIDKAGMTSIARIKTNCMLQTPELMVFKEGFHTDYPKDLMTGIYYINTNDGGTLFEESGQLVNSVANRMVVFDSQLRHVGMTCTNQKRRIVVNFNYRIKEADEEKTSKWMK